jgi:antitoxin ParD1/3/4
MRVPHLDACLAPPSSRIMIVRQSMNVSITPELRQFVSERVATGRYQNASEVVRAALRLLREQGAENRQHVTVD